MDAAARHRIDGEAHSPEAGSIAPVSGARAGRIAPGGPLIGRARRDAVAARVEAGFTEPRHVGEVPGLIEGRLS
ncbi:hypothetical protein [Methylobacterium nodulans]|uniref:Uncharacterized protein n=1 Tax=Methylobacterium nodulans (strain LMG 21967 / CNCM I-2342 / ORS 2060) TaxID=460265 RepID=B8IL39_METNO|nr:hypothetical protein [Methylobacterium nodulans]ACL58227.1 hypothetical protein Mnod_3304 [Methylobacterium nodulans ORS 2060]